jgi:hypothetical protein
MHFAHVNDLVLMLNQINRLPINCKSHLCTVRLDERPLCARTRPSVRSGIGPDSGTRCFSCREIKTVACFERRRSRRPCERRFPGATLTPFHLRPANFRTDPRRSRTKRCENEPARPADGCAESRHPIPWRASDEASYVTGSVLMCGRRRPIGAVKQWPSYPR